MEAVAEMQVLEPEVVEKRDEKDLADVYLLTEMIREHERQIRDLARKRRAKINRLRAHRITFREIAASTGITEQAVFKIVRQGKDDQ